MTPQEGRDMRSGIGGRKYRGQQRMDKTTIDYYNQNADTFAEQTVAVDFTETQDRFLKSLRGSGILDFGCGSGRDAKYFSDLGYEVSAIDGSEELCKIARAYSGIDVRHMYFQDLDEQEIYDGIWACSSILHLSKSELKDVLAKMGRALKPEGIIYTSFKYGEFEGERNGRYFTDFTPEAFRDFLRDVPGLCIEEYWITGDVRPGRGAEKWLNVILMKD